MHSYRFIILLLLQIVYVTDCSLDVSSHSCIHVTRKIAKNGYAATEGACLQCDPASNSCPFGCQLLIDRVFLQCSGQCIPEGYYFDPAARLSGCFEENTEAMVIAAQRCGCNSTSNTIAINSMLTMAVIVISTIAMTMILM